MTARAGKRKGRRTRKPDANKPRAKRLHAHGARGSEIVRDGVPESVHPSGDDHLPANASVFMEARAVTNGWLLETAEAAKLREHLLLRMIKIAGSSPDERLAVHAFRAVTMAEHRERQLRSVSGLVLDGTATVRPQQPYEVIQALLERADIQGVLQGKIEKPAT